MEEKTNQNTEVKNGHRKESKIIFILSLVLVVTLILALVTSIVLLFFSVKEIEVVGDSRYDYADIIEASKIRVGNRLYYLNETKAENAILAAFPYIKNVKVSSYFPNRVKIEIEEFEDVYLVPHSDGFCYVNSEFEILEIVDKAPTYERFSGIFIKLEKCAEGGIGSIYQSESTQRATDMIKFIKEYGFYGYLNIIDVEDKYNNSFVVAKKYKFILGAMTDLSEKIDYAFKVCLDDSFDKENNAIIDVTVGQKVILRYVNDENIRQEFDFCQN